MTVVDQRQMPFAGIILEVANKPPVAVVMFFDNHTIL